MNRKEIVKLIDATKIETIQLRDTRLDDKDERLIRAGALYKAFMEEVGIKLKDDNLETPYRVAKMFVNELCEGLMGKPPVLTLFDNNKNYDEYVVVNSIPYNSVCGHHHLPFFGKAYIAYRPGKKVLGLSKFARVVEYFASKPQIQEGLTREILDFLAKELEPEALMVIMKGQHLCMLSRGVRAHGSTMTTSALTGDVDKNEVMRLFDL